MAKATHFSNFFDAILKIFSFRGQQLTQPGFYVSEMYVKSLLQRISSRGLIVSVEMFFPHHAPVFPFSFVFPLFFRGSWCRTNPSMEFLSKEMRLNLSFLSFAEAFCVFRMWTTHTRQNSFSSPQCLSWSCCVRMEKGHKIIEKKDGSWEKDCWRFPNQKESTDCEKLFR